MTSERVVNLRECVRADWGANRRDPKAQLVLLAFRTAHWLRTGPRWLAICSLPLVFLYRATVEGVLGIELRPKTVIGPGLRLFHGTGVVIHDHSVIGRNVTLRQHVTIGQAVPGGPCPVIGNDVEFGVGATVLGGVRVGDRASIGALALVTSDVPDGGVARAPKAVIHGPRRTPGET